jgi:hypothetical protein
MKGTSRPPEQIVLKAREADPLLASTDRTAPQRRALRQRLVARHGKYLAMMMSAPPALVWPGRAPSESPTTVVLPLPSMATPYP